MSAFYYKNNELYVDNIPLASIAREYGTPCYIYSRKTIEENWQAFDNPLANFPHRICYAVKANSNLAILNTLAKLGSGFDIVSQGELERVLVAGGDPHKIIFSGVGKSHQEIDRALEVGIFCFNVESEEELKNIQAIAKRQNKTANISLRINPNIDARTHPYIATGLNENKFGIELADAIPLCKEASKLSNLKLIGIGCHIGSQLTELNPYLEALDCLFDIADKLHAEGVPLKNIDIGGGLGICYKDENPPSIADYITALRQKFAKHPFEIILEPGRIMVGNAGILLTKVEYLKHNHHKNFAIVDAGMTDLIRPSLYDAWHNIIPIKKEKKFPEKIYDIVGPVCESSDFLGKNRQFALEAGDLLAICDAGAYGFTMSSNYNTRPRAAEVMVDDNKSFLIRRRESIQDLYAHENMI